MVQANVLWLGVLVFGANGSPLLAKDVEAIEELNIATWQQHTTITKDVRMLRREGNRRWVSEGTVRILKQGDTILLRKDLEASQFDRVGDRERKMDSHQQASVCDGQHCYSYFEGMDSASKRSDTVSRHPKDVLEARRKRLTLALLPNEVLDGEPAYVIQGIRKNRQAESRARTLSYYRADGMLVKKAHYNDEGDLFKTYVYTNIRFDLAMNPEDFVFKVPKGIPIKEMKSGQGHLSRRLDD